MTQAPILLGQFQPFLRFWPLWTVDIFGEWKLAIYVSTLLEILGLEGGVNCPNTVSTYRVSTLLEILAKRVEALVPLDREASFNPS